jgi:hypothetical protein
MESSRVIWLTRATAHASCSESEHLPRTLRRADRGWHGQAALAALVGQLARVYRRHPSAPAEVATSEAATKSLQPPAGTQSPLSARALYPSSAPFGRLLVQRIPGPPHSACVLLADSSVADTKASQASTLLVCLLLACQASTLSSRNSRHPRRSVHIAAESWPAPWLWALRRTAEPRLRLLHCPTARWAGCTYRRKRLGLHRGCTDGTGSRLSLEP